MRYFSKLIAITWSVIFLGTSAAAFAGECVVTEHADGTGEGTLRWAVSKAAGGGCATEDARYRERYQQFYPGATRFHVIRWTGSMDIYTGETVIIGPVSDSDPVVLVADDGAAVRIRGDGSVASVGLAIAGERVIVDNLSVQSFDGMGLKIEGDDNLIIRSRVLAHAEDGVVVRGTGNRLVDCEVAHNGFNGVVIGASNAASGCASGNGISREGRGTSLLAVSIHDNGEHVIGQNCAESTDAAPAACALIRLEATHCWDMMRSTPPCEQPFGVGAEDSCIAYWHERIRCDGLLTRAGYADDADRDDVIERWLEAVPGANGGFGVLVNATDVSLDGWQPQGDGGARYGVAEPFSDGGYASIMRKNRSYGVFVNSTTPAWICRDVAAAADLGMLNAVAVSETAAEGNGTTVNIAADNGLYINGPHPPRIVHVAAVGDERTGEYVVTGSVRGSNDGATPWTTAVLNPQAVRIEVYLAAEGVNEGTYFLAARDGVDAASGDFTVHLPNPIIIDGVTALRPSFVVSYVDTETGATAPMSHTSMTSQEGDSDGDGLPDVQEDIDGDGIVGPGETDPANPDTDGDGLTDGEERLHLGRIGALAAGGIVFHNLAYLDPANPDSDGDCLPDGLEVGVDRAAAEAMIASMRTFPRYDLSPSCRALLSKRAIIKLENVIPYDASAPVTLYNIAMMYDVDPTSVTDPTSADTDRDGMMDGEEDWNFSGHRDGTAAKAETKVEQVPVAVIGLAKAYDYAKPTGGKVLDTCVGDAAGWTETDPTLPDSDGDGLRDGDEGSTDTGDKPLEKNESSPLLCDTDDDGVPDSMEFRMGTFPNSCDSDEDGLADGIELGIIHPTSATPDCRGLQAAGTNMRHPNALDPTNPDSDGDGLEDGVEDINHNGWVDGSESDPSLADTDGDGIEDGIEFTGDFDGDGIPDFDMRFVNNGRDCSPPAEIGDLDCDGIPNARDEDSDNDGCPDALEGGWMDNDGNGIPDMFDANAIGCSAGGGGGVPSVSTGSGDEEQENLHRVPDWALDISQGGTCSLMADNERPHALPVIWWFCGIAFIVATFYSARRLGV